jgi:hypothetical protein
LDKVAFKFRKFSKSLFVRELVNKVNLKYNSVFLGFLISGPNTLSLNHLTNADDTTALNKTRTDLNFVININ